MRTIILLAVMHGWYILAEPEEVADE